jgi:soluble lytic murein transglycosylase-like protein
VSPVVQTGSPVLQWAGLAQKYGAQYGIPPAVLLGLIDVESGGREGLTSSTGAQGITQFEPSTARSYGVTFGNAESEVRGAAHYLVDLGAHNDLRTALAKYNGGPGNPQYSYADTVLSRAKRYGSLKPGDVSPGLISAPTAPGTPPSGFLPGLTRVALVAGGAVLAITGISRAAGVRNPLAAAAKAAVP